MDDVPAHRPQRTEEESAAIARHLRHAANKIGPQLPLCLPGEPQECGRNAHHHVLVWAAAVKAAAQHVIETEASTGAQAAFAANNLYERFLQGLRTERDPAAERH
ncbi:hypothetical protein AT728_37645 [Streptomyces silvensis]|uniref:Uncharacterized protein n=1 Tax=Streptomyces silvensis TaxID=1765722 RepID=A0A0W7WR97_9ACTN|nr:hypothetical protein AT728_37645 [Streptomyces silvensis]